MTTDKHRRAFISYSRTNKEFATKLTKGLRSAGFPVWFDLMDIPTGARWDDEVEKALRECSIFLIILTPASIASENVKDEIGYAIDHGKRILPVLLEDCDVPLRLRRFQYVDFTTKSFEEGFDSAKELLRDLVDEVSVPVVAKAPVVETQIDGKAEAERLALVKAETERKAKEEADRLAIQKAERDAQAEADRKAKEMAKPVEVKTELASAAPAQKKPMSKGLVIGIVVVVVLCIAGIGFGALSSLGTPATEAPVIENPATEVPVVDNPATEVPIVDNPATPTATPEKVILPNSPTPKPTIVANTPTPKVQQYSTENFDAELKNWENFIVNGKTETISNEEINNVTIDVQDGWYLFDLARNQVWAYSIYDAFEYEDVRVDTRVENLGTNDNNVSLICRYSKDAGWYEFNVANNGLYWILFAKPNAGGLVSYRTIANGGSTKVKMGNEVNEYSIVCNGDDLMLYINGDLTKSTIDDLKSLRTGKIGVSVSSFNNFAEVRFDWLKTSQP